MKRATIVLLCLSSGLAYAQVQRSGGDAGTARLMQQLQELQSQQAQARAESDKLKQENDSLKQQLQKLQGDQGALAQRAATLEAAARRDAQASRDGATATENLRGQMQELITRFRDTAQNLKDVETDRTKVRGDLAVREQDLKACSDRNAKLYGLNADVLNQLEHRGFWAAVAEHEPFTRIARTRLENLAEDYRSRAEELRQPPPKRP